MRFGRRESSNRSGAVILLVLILLPVFLFLLAISLDLSFMHLSRAEIRAAADASARAGGEALSRTQDIEQAKQAAKNVAAMNTVAGAPLILADTDIIFGASTLQTDGAWSFTPGATPYNSLRVNARRTTDSPSGAIDLFLGGLYGPESFQPTQSATVVRLDRDICLVVDRSSSMKLAISTTAPNMSTSDPRFCQIPQSDSRWLALDASIDVFNSLLDATPYSERVSLVSYGSNGTWCGVTNNQSDVDQTLTSNTSLIGTAMDEISNRIFNGATNISAGMHDGVAILTGAGARPYAAKTMIVMTDGNHTQGSSPVIAAGQAYDNGVIVHTITFGNGANQDIMRQAAVAGHGSSYHAPNATALTAAFQDIALSLPVMLTE